MKRKPRRKALMDDAGKSRLVQVRKDTYDHKVMR